MPGPGVLVQCKRCMTQAVIPEGTDPHHPDEGLQCADPAASGCCEENHNHGEAANATGVPCRPVQFFANAVVTPVIPASEG